jgi:hypothetical protein
MIKIQDPVPFTPGSGKGKKTRSGIREKHPVSATIVYISLQHESQDPNPHHCYKMPNKEYCIVEHGIVVYCAQCVNTL